MYIVHEPVCVCVINKFSSIFFPKTGKNRIFFLFILFVSIRLSLRMVACIRFDRERAAVPLKNDSHALVRARGRNHILQFESESEHALRYFPFEKKKKIDKRRRQQQQAKRYLYACVNGDSAKQLVKSTCRQKHIYTLTNTTHAHTKMDKCLK